MRARQLGAAGNRGELEIYEAGVYLVVRIP
jgi:hypothetical protein